MRSEFGDIQIVLARELTKIHEEVLRENIATLRERFQKKEARGEYVIVFNLSNPTYE